MNPVDIASVFPDDAAHPYVRYERFDVAEVKRAYQKLPAQLKPSPRPKPIVVDEGEEPVEDDTPVVVPKP